MKESYTKKSEQGREKLLLAQKYCDDRMKRVYISWMPFRLELMVKRVWNARRLLGSKIAYLWSKSNIINGKDEIKHVVVK